MTPATESLTYTCIDCGKTVTCEPFHEPDELMDWEDLGDSGCQCWECRPKVLPELTAQEIAQFGTAVLDLMREIDDHTLHALTRNGLTQCAEDLKAATEPIWRAMDALLQDGPRMVYAVAYPDEEPSA